MTDAPFELAKKADAEPRFLQIAAKPVRRRKGKPQPKLTRVAFRVSRLMEFCTKRELQNQTGHSWQEWPLVALKELVDNALDACEEFEELGAPDDGVRHAGLPDQVFLHFFGTHVAAVLHEIDSYNRKRQVMLYAGIDFGRQ